MKKIYKQVVSWFKKMGKSKSRVSSSKGRSTSKRRERAKYPGRIPAMPQEKWKGPKF